MFYEGYNLSPTAHVNEVTITWTGAKIVKNTGRTSTQEQTNQ